METPSPWRAVELARVPNQGAVSGKRRTFPGSSRSTRVPRPGVSLTRCRRVETAPARVQRQRASNAATRVCIPSSMFSTFVCSCARIDCMSVLHSLAQLPGSPRHCLQIIPVWEFQSRPLKEV